MSDNPYFAVARDALQRVADTQDKAIDAAAQMMVEAIAAGKALFAFGATHSFILVEEMVYRTGGLMLVNPIYPHGMNLSVRPMTATSRLERVAGLGTALLANSPARAGDVLLLVSTSGRNAVAIDMAIEAQRCGISTIAITALAYTAGVASRHPSGKKLADLCDIVIDNCVPCGDAAVAVPGCPQKIGPLSSLTGVAIVNAMAVAVVQKLVARGSTPPVFMSANLDGGDEYNARLLAENRQRIHYMD